MLTPKINAKELISRSETLKKDSYEKNHTSFEKAFSKIEEDISAKLKNLKGVGDNLKITVYLHKEPVDQETLEKLKAVYSDAGFNIEQEAHEELVPYTGQPNRGGGYTPAEYETEYKLIVSINKVA
ncbi:hypothetical protein ACTOJ1_001065 [Shigella flexneri]